MKVDSVVSGAKFGDVAALAREQEDLGYDGVWTDETSHDPFFPLLLASQATSRVELGTAIAVAFARNPMTMAVTANDLHLASHGRFVLGLGSQIKAHIERRFSMPWSRPAARMREYVLAMRAIWRAWNEGERLDFQGDFYTHTLMTPFFDPGPNPYGTPKVFVAAVGEVMTTVAGEVADGLLVHSFTTERYLKEVTMPTLTRGLEKSGRDRSAIEVVYAAFVATGIDEEELASAVTATRKQIAFYGSTPAYRPVLELHGWADLHTELNALSKSDRPDKWDAMGELIDDEVLDAFAVVAEPEKVAARIEQRYGGVADRISFYSRADLPPERWAPVLHGLRGE